MVALPFASPLQFGVLEKRYKRFLADITLDSGETITAHCPNSGSMLGLKEPGMRVGVSVSEDSRRKHPYTWEVVDTGTTLAGINTARPNRLVGLALQTGVFAECDGYEHIRPEAVVPDGRLDFFLSGHDSQPDCWLEVKNVQLRRGDALEFPDAKTTRGVKHLRILEEQVRRGQRGVLLFLAQRDDANRFRVAADIDPAYAAAFTQARAAGVEMYCYTCQHTAELTVWHASVVVE